MRFESKPVSGSCFREAILILLLGGFFCCPYVLAQENQVLDSLLSLLPTLKEDTLKAKSLNNVAKEYQKLRNPAKAREFAEEGLALAETLKFRKGEALIHHTLGMIHKTEYDFEKALHHFTIFSNIGEEMEIRSYKGDAELAMGGICYGQGLWDEALLHYTAALPVWREMNNKYNESMTYFNIGLCLEKKGNYEKARENYYNSINVKKEIEDEEGIAFIHHMLGSTYEDEGNYPEAVKHFLSALEISTDLNFLPGMADSYNDIGRIYGKQNNYPQALKHFESAYTIYEQLGNKRSIAGLSNNLGAIYLNQGESQKAIEKFSTFLKIAKELNYKKDIGLACFNIAQYYYRQAKIEKDAVLKETLLQKALDVTNEGVTHYRSLHDNEGLAGIYSNLGLILTAQGKFTEARDTLNKALALARSVGIKEHIRHSYQALFELDTTTGNWQSAVTNMSLFVLYRDSLVNEENKTQIERQHLQYAFDKKEDSLRFEQTLTSQKLNNQILLTQKQKQDLLLKEQEISFVQQEGRLHQLEIEKNQADLAAQKAELESKGSEMVILNKEATMQRLELRRQTLLKNFLFIGLALLGIGAFFAYRFYHTRQLLKLQTLRNKIANDLHDDVGSTLSSISIFSEMAQQQSKEAIPLLDTIHDSSKKMLEAMADIVWTINPENDQFEKILLRMKNFAYELLGARNIDFEFTAEDDVAQIKLPMDVRKNLFLIFKEATNNMVKYSEATRAQFAITNENNHIVMKIRDNGKGFDANASTAGNGIKSMKKRAADIGGIFSLESYPGNGTTIQLKVAV